jgi:hypothetical protein
MRAREGPGRARCRGTPPSLVHGPKQRAER